MADPFRIVTAPDRERWYRAVEAVPVTEPVTDERLAEIEARARQLLREVEGRAILGSDGRTYLGDYEMQVRHAAETSIPDLIAEVRRLRAELESYEIDAAWHRVPGW